MKYFKIVPVLLLCSVSLFYSCKEEAEAPIEETNSKIKETNATDFLNTIAPSNATVPNQPTSEPAQNASGVWHYTCSKGCAGGAGSAVNCTTCGSLLQHNQTYHTNNTPATTQKTPPSPQTTTTTNTVAAPQAEPAQNAAGVWHYTCEKGCAGGSGAPENCKSCGTLLAHNQAYHQ